jgi:hypothetical protein
MLERSDLHQPLFADGGVPPVAPSICATVRISAKRQQSFERELG